MGMASACQMRWRNPFMRWKYSQGRFCSPLLQWPWQCWQAGHVNCEPWQINSQVRALICVWKHLHTVYITLNPLTVDDPLPLDNQVPVSKYKFTNKECNANKYCYCLRFQRTVTSILFRWWKLCSSFHFLASSVFLILPSVKHKFSLQENAVQSGSLLTMQGLVKSSDRSSSLQIILNPQLLTWCV